MKKDEFLSLLEKRLHILNEKERQDILDEYRTHIEMKMQEGKDEEEACLLYTSDAADEL